MAKKKSSSKRSTVASRAHQRFSLTHDRACTAIAARNLTLGMLEQWKHKVNDEHKMALDIAMSDITRSAVMLGVASMDTYFTARFAELLVPYIKKKGAKQSLVATLADAGLDTSQALEMLTMDKPYRRIRTLIDAYLERYTTQRIEVIDKLFLCYGLKNFCASAQKKAKRKNLIRRVELIVERRHKIVHDGDLNSHHKLNKIDHDEVLRQLKDLKVFVDSAHSITENLR